MSQSTYNAQAQTPQEHFGNCEFQLGNVKGWLMIAGNPENALVKAECLLEATQQLIAALKAQTGDQS